MRRFRDVLLLVVLPLLLLSAFLYLLPPIRERVDYHVEQLRLQIRYALFPPENAVFTPQNQQDQVAQIVQQTMQALTLTPRPEVVATYTPSPTPTRGPSSTPEPTATITPSPTPLPPAVALKGVRYVDQHGAYNYCAPANLAMGLSYWGWKGTRSDTGQILKPFDRDLNVMPYEMVDYVTNQTDLKAVWRSGGTLDTLKTFTAAGFPVLVEKGAYMLDLTGKVTWMGHYQVITGYNDRTQEFIAQDSFYRPDFPVTYAEMEKGMRAFNGVFIVIYPPDREADVNALLGPYAEEQSADQIALKRADMEKDSLTGIDQYFAWFNRGTSLVRLQDYAGAASAYDQAFKLYELLPKDSRPWRMLWYQTGPYFAYFYSGRYQDVVDLASLTINNANNPYLEESFYWRGLAYRTIGKPDEAVQDFKTALEYHPGFAPALEQLSQMGIQP